jgi:hypothetical protein
MSWTAKFKVRTPTVNSRQPPTFAGGKRSKKSGTLLAETREVAAGPSGSEKFLPPALSTRRAVTSVGVEPHRRAAGWRSHISHGLMLGEQITKGWGRSPTRRNSWMCRMFGPETKFPAETMSRYR